MHLKKKKVAKRVYLKFSSQENNALSMYGDRFQLELFGDYFATYLNIKSLYCTPETNMSITSKFKKNFKTSLNI